MFEGFTHCKIALSDAVLNVRYGGFGPPLLLLHGHPRTHATWSNVAPRLAAFFTVVCPELRGFGESSKLLDLPDHAGSSKRAKAKDCIELMGSLGFERFAIVGHDRGITGFSLPSRRNPSEPFLRIRMPGMAEKRPI
ncbi:alpha/beta hydrolase [Rahnella bonaserana]|uniref:alpha/beta fold hydrolase n=1 Tax=Rahnella bonaserana TaxID=2816248 RepID=UPI0032095631